MTWITTEVKRRKSKNKEDLVKRLPLSLFIKRPRVTAACVNLCNSNFKFCINANFHPQCSLFPGANALQNSQHRQQPDVFPIPSKTPLYVSVYFSKGIQIPSSLPLLAHHFLYQHDNPMQIALTIKQLPAQI